MQPSTTTDGKGGSEAAITEVVKESKGTGPVREDAEEYFFEKLVGHNCTETEMQYRVWWYGYRPSEDKDEPGELLPKPSLTGTGKVFRRSDRDPASRGGSSATRNHTDNGSHNGMKS